MDKLFTEVQGKAFPILIDFVVSTVSSSKKYKYSSWLISYLFYKIKIKIQMFLFTKSHFESHYYLKTYDLFHEASHFGTDPWIFFHHRTTFIRNLPFFHLWTIPHILWNQFLDPLIYLFPHSDHLSTALHRLNYHQHQ